MNINKLVDEINEWFPEKIAGMNYFSCQSFTDFKCMACGKVDTWCNGSTPMFCHECLKELKEYLKVITK